VQEYSVLYWKFLQPPAQCNFCQQERRAASQLLSARTVHSLEPAFARASHLNFDEHFESITPHQLIILSQNRGPVVQRPLLSILTKAMASLSDGADFKLHKSCEACSQPRGSKEILSQVFHTFKSRDWLAEKCPREASDRDPWRLLFSIQCLPAIHEHLI